MDGNILSRGYPFKLEDHGNSRGGGGLKQKCPQWGGEGRYGYFLELHMIIIILLHELAADFFNLQPIKYIS